MRRQACYKLALHGVVSAKGMFAALVFAVVFRFRACYGLGRKLHRNADSTVCLVPSRSLFPAFLCRF
jgi:hypothetical protein